MPTDEQISKMLDAWYQLTGRRFEPFEAERIRDFREMKRRIADFEANLGVHHHRPQPGTPLSGTKAILIVRDEIDERR